VKRVISEKTLLDIAWKNIQSRFITNDLVSIILKHDLYCSHTCENRWSSWE